MRPFVTARTFCASLSGPRYSGFSRNLPERERYFCSVYDYVEKTDLSKGYENPKRKLGVTAYYSEMIELKFGKKMPYIFIFFVF